MALAQLIISSIIALIIAAVGWYAGSSYRMQTRIRLLELRVEAYRKLFEATEITSPTRLGRGERLSPEDALKLGRAIYNWYYENGNGLLMPDSTRMHLQDLQQKLQGEPLRREASDPLLVEVGHLRTLLRQDIGVFATGGFRALSYLACFLNSEPARKVSETSTLEAEIRYLPADAARMVAVEILLSDPEALGDDVLEAAL
jgi:hypothetical protein